MDLQALARQVYADNQGADTDVIVARLVQAAASDGIAVTADEARTALVEAGLHHYRSEIKRQSENTD